MEREREEIAETEEEGGEWVRERGKVGKERQET